MILVMGVSLFTSRIILNKLGAVDFGIYNVVGGVVVMLSSLNGAMSAATSRFLAFDLGKKDLLQYQRTFSIALIIHVAIAILVVILAETLGLWLVYSKLVIPPDRFDAALWVFHLSVLSSLLTLTQVPYSASIIAHEQMGIYAYIGVMEVVLKLLIVYLLGFNYFDSLKLYAVLILIVTLVISLIPRIYCYINYKECRFVIVKDRKLYKKMLCFSSWDLIGNMSAMVQGQGINIILNVFCGPIVNAARGIAYQVEAALASFVQNFIMAVRPQIIKSYAEEEYKEVINLVFYSSKFSFLLFSCFAIPLILECDYVLTLWLKVPPDYSIIFTKLVLINYMIVAFIQPIIAGVHAAGNIKELNIYVGLTSLIRLPLAYVALKYGGNPVSVFYIILSVTPIMLVLDLWILKRNINYSILSFLKKVIGSGILLIFPAFIAAWFIHEYFPESFLRVVAIVVTYCFITAIAVYNFGIGKVLQTKIKVVLYSKLIKICRKKY